MISKKQLTFGLVLALGIQACGKEKETRIVDNPEVAQENAELKTKVAALEKELEGKLLLGQTNEKLQAELAASADAKAKLEQLLRFAQARSLVKPAALLTALDEAIAAAADDAKPNLVGLRDFYKSILPEGGNVTLYCSKLIDRSVEKGLLTADQGKDFKLEGSAPVFEKPGDINTRLVGVATCEAVYNSLFE